MRYLTARRGVIDGHLINDMWVGWEGDQIAATGQGVCPGEPENHFQSHVLVPGFVDMHCHGGGGEHFAGGGPCAARSAADAHLRHGTTTLVASIATAEWSQMLADVRGLAPLIEDGTLVGIHAEGPWLSPRRRGAHASSVLRVPDSSDVQALLDTAAGTLVMVTIAPELPHALAAIGQLVDADVVVALGHTDCDYDTASAAIDAGASVATHLFNAMPPIAARTPGPSLALLADPRVRVELIADGVHVDAALLRYVVNTVGPQRVAAITDAMAAAGATDGDYLLGESVVTVRDGIAQSSSGVLAGSTATMAQVFRMWVGQCGLSVPDAARLCATTPATILNLPDRGEISAGRRADIVVLDDDLDVAAVLRGGSWVVGESHPATRS
jgi:N-acetylglucosamine-6-phosphate deacetylase